MKRAYFLLSLILCFAMVGCDEEVRIDTMAELELSNTYVSIKPEGGSATITLTATESWAFNAEQIPDWLTISPLSGNVGTFAVHFTAEATAKTRKVSDLKIKVGDKVQFINVEQSIGIVPVSTATCAEVIAGADGKTYRVSGKVTSIVNTLYGNWYLADDTGEIYIYGTLDKHGADKNFLSLGIEEGDVVTVEGPKLTYNGVVELVDVTVISIKKSLISAVDKEVSAGKEGGVVDVKLLCKGNGVNFDIPEEAKPWLSVQAITAVGDTTVVSLNVLPNDGGARSIVLEFTTVANGATYFAPVTLRQAGAIMEVSLGEFLAAEVSDALYRLTGKITRIANTKYGNFYMMDANDTVYVYGISDPDGRSFTELGIVEGDIITLVGKRAAYKGNPQVGGAVYEKHIGSTVATVAEVLAAPVGDAYYRVTGVVSKIMSDIYGNFDLTDDTGTIYVYGLTNAPVAKNNKSFANLGIQLGDTVTLIGKRAAYKDNPQIGGAYYFSHTPASN